MADVEGTAAFGAEVPVRRARELIGPDVMNTVPGWSGSADALNAAYEAPTGADVESDDAIISGTPARFTSMSPAIKRFIDSLGGLWFRGALYGKVGSAFCATSRKHGGNEATLLSMYHPLAHLGLIIVPLGYSDPVMFAAGTPYGATAIGDAGSQ